MKEEMLQRLYGIKLLMDMKARTALRREDRLMYKNYGDAVRWVLNELDAKQIGTKAHLETLSGR